MNWMIKGDKLTDYLEACKYAAGDGFANFKQDKRLRVIFEHCSYDIAENYERSLTVGNLNLLTKYKFTNQHYGNPSNCNSTYQYIGVLSNLIKLFGSLDNLRIVEIGGGYGGQARTILDVFKPACYHIIDLPEVTQLQFRYLKEFDVVDCFTAPTGQEYDLVISNYALSEIKDNSVYMEEVVKKSTHGYLTCNTDFVKLDFEHKRTPDIEGESKENYILTW